MKKRALFAGVLSVMLLMCSACAEEFSAVTAQNWLGQFAVSAGALPVRNDPQQTADPARAGEKLMEYDFGTVVLAGETLTPQAIAQIDIRSAQVRDPRGVSVGMDVGSALGGMYVSGAATQLYVLGTLDSGLGWSWAYVNEQGVYGVEYVCYGEEAGQMREYTLTYVIDHSGIITSIRLRMADATPAQAQSGFSTAQEILQRQHGEVYAAANGQEAFSSGDLQVMGGRALGVPVYDFVVRLGEPVEIQTLQEGRGRLLLYEGAVVEVGLYEPTGEEIVRGITALGSDITGPRGICTGMSVQEASALIRCDQDVSSMGGVLYLDGEAAGEPPYAELTRSADGSAALRYLCMDERGQLVCLEVGVSEGIVAYWRLEYEEGTYASGG